MSMKRILLASLLVAIVLLPIGKAQALCLPKLPLSGNTLSVSSFESHFNALAKQASDPDQPDPEKIVYLTFDDGPDPKWTPQILEILARYHAGATFYMIGRNANTHPEIVRQVAEQNQNIAVHGYNHMDMSHIDFQTFYYEVYDSEEVIRKALKAEPNLEAQFGKCLRPPYGRTSEYLYQNASEMDYEVSMWHIDTKDWQQPAPEEMLAELLKRLEPGKVILMHDGGEERAQTLLGLQLILHELIMQGYQILPYCTSEGQATSQN
ncbi:MAG: polysaccharide deacetylase family protein [Anaerolineaceae bacterium]|jgi:peptidoglycan/xylan/chitin deacetylase (PgdA/CDA1 family)